MRIGLSTSVIDKGQTGISRYVSSLVQAFLDSVGKHRFILFVLEKDLRLFEFVTPQVEVVPVSEKFRSPLQNILWHQTVLPGLAAHHHLNVLHVPSYRRMLWKQPCALVATIHDLAPFHIRHKYDWKRMLYGRYLARFLAHRQHQIIAISQSTADDIGKFFHIPSKRVRVIYNGVDHGKFFPADSQDASSQTAACFKLTQPFFLYVARLEHPGKNHVRLISAFDQFKVQTKSPIQLVLAGKAWTGAEEIHRAAAKATAAADIRLLGFVPEDKLPMLYRAAQAVVCPSLFEGFGLPLVEAMACGCPVLCSNAGSLAEVIGDAGLSVDPHNVFDLARQLNVLANDQQMRQRLRLKGLARAQLFNWHQNAAATLDVYARAMEKFSRLQGFRTWKPGRTASAPVTIP